MKDLEFDEKYTMDITISGQKDGVVLYLADTLLDSLKTLPNISDSLKSKISSVIAKSDIWLQNSINRIKSEVKDECEVQLISIYILSEENMDSLIFGLEFWLSTDEEHGRGMKLRSDTFEIIDYGLADVAFC